MSRFIIYLSMCLLCFVLLTPAAYSSIKKPLNEVAFVVVDDVGSGAIYHKETKQVSNELLNYSSDKKNIVTLTKNVNHKRKHRPAFTPGFESIPIPSLVKAKYRVASCDTRHSMPKLQPADSGFDRVAYAYRLNPRANV